MSRSGLIGAAGSSNSAKGCSNQDNYGHITFSVPFGECNGGFPSIHCFEDDAAGKNGVLIDDYITDGIVAYTKVLCLGPCAKEIKAGFFYAAEKLQKISNSTAGSGIVTIGEGAFQEAGRGGGFAMGLDKAEVIKGSAFKSSKFAGELYSGTVGINPNLIFLGESAFAKCSLIRKVTIPSTLTNNPAFNDEPEDPDFPNPPPPPNGVYCATVSQRDINSNEKSKDVPLFLQYDEVIIEGLQEDGVLPLTYVADVEGSEVETPIGNWTMHVGKGSCDFPSFDQISIFTPYDNGVAVELEEGPSIFVIGSYSGTTGSPKDATGGFFSVSVADGPCKLEKPAGDALANGWQKSTFEQSGLTYATIMNGVSYIPDRTFFECIRLSNQGVLNIPSSVNRIGTEAYRGCISLSVVTILGRPTVIGKGAFYDCSISSISVDGEEYIPDPATAAQGVAAAPTPPSTIIEEEAFKGNQIVEMTINKVGEIGTEAFQGSVAADVNFDSSVELNIGFRAFADNTFLGGETTIPATTIAAGAFSNVNWVGFVN